jgi:type IV pilus assembly protein PilQ
MRLKQLLGVIATLLLLTVLAAGAGSQLTNVSATSQSGVTTVTLQTNGAFSHNEYRPADTLLLVDLTGVSAGKLNERQSALEGPGVKSYRVLTYKGANGAEVTRLELVLAEGVQFKVLESRGALNVRVGSTEALAAVSPAEAKPSIAKAETKPAVAKTEPKAVAQTESKPLTTPASGSAVAKISKVTVAPANDGLDIEVNGASNAKAMRLTGPDRIVLDIANSLPSASAHNVPVNNGDVKGVRVGRFQEEPPTTRIVIDLAGSRNFEIVPGDNKFTVHVQGSTTAAPKSEPKPMKKVDPTPVMAKSEPVANAPVSAQKQQPAELKQATFAAAPTQAPVAQLQNASLVKASAPVETKPAVVENSTPAKAETTVFVEPTFKDKEEDAKTDDPAQRASGAASVIASSSVHPSDTLVPKTNGALQASVPSVNAALQQQQQAPPAASRPRYTGEPISVNLKDVDLKDFFRLVHEISGLNIVLDPNVKGSLTIVLDDVPWDQALQIVLQNNGLDKQLEGNVLRIATVDTFRREAEGKRAQEEAQALAVSKQTVTRFLSYAHSKDVVPTVKRFLSARGDVIADERTNALIIQDIPAVIPEIDRLLVQLDRKTQEVEIEARVVAATRNFARDIGMQLGFGWGNGTTAVGGSAASSGLTNPVTGSKYFTTPTGSAIPLFSNFGVPTATSGLVLSNATRDYRLDAILTMAESRGLLKILSRPRIVTQNNITALVRQGFRIPVVTQAQLGGPPTVTYVDAFLRLTVTPQITVENTIFLAVDVENTTPDFGRTVSGNPTLITQQATTQVLVTDGGTVVIGGVIQTQNNLNVSQVPLLGDLPILGNLFKRRTVTTTTQELIFFLSPKIIQT